MRRTSWIDGARVAVAATVLGAVSSVSRDVQAIRHSPFAVESCAETIPSQSTVGGAGSFVHQTIERQPGHVSGETTRVQFVAPPHGLHER